ncbi:MAG TPA: EF-hand domain-containing protein [Sphingomonas sp.]
MLKQILMTGAAMIAVPALAQTAPGRTAMTPNATQQTAPAPTAATAPTGDAMTAQTNPATPAPAAPADPIVSSDNAQTTGTATAAAQPTPATTPTSVAQIVDREFGAYDKDADGKLSQSEFGAWMVALKTATDPATKADSPATKQWIGAAFTQADKDKSLAVTKPELTGFLSQGQSNS